MTPNAHDSSRQLPAAIRKQLLQARMAVERVEFAQALEAFRGEVRPGQLARHALRGSGLGSLNPLDGLLRALRFTGSHPYLGSLLGSAASLLLRRRLGRSLLWRVLKLGLSGGAVYALVQSLRQSRRAP